MLRIFHTHENNKQSGKRWIGCYGISGKRIVGTVENFKRIALGIGLPAIAFTLLLILVISFVFILVTSFVFVFKVS